MWKLRTSLKQKIDISPKPSPLLDENADLDQNIHSVPRTDSYIIYDEISM